MTPLPHCNLTHPWLRYHIEEYTDDIVHDFERRLETIWDRSVNRVYILDFEGLTPEMRRDLVVRLRMVYTGEDRKQVFVSHAWRRLFEIRGPLVRGFILEFLSTWRWHRMGLEHTGLKARGLSPTRGTDTEYKFFLNQYSIKNGQPQYHYGGIHQTSRGESSKSGETFNWQTTTYGKMEYCEDEDDCFTNFKTKFPAIVQDNTLTSDAAISCEPTVSPLNDNELTFEYRLTNPTMKITR
ncbi:hypothetical protein Tco_0646837 [Tanacetum coccineum]